MITASQAIILTMPREDAEALRVFIETYTKSGRHAVDPPIYEDWHWDKMKERMNSIASILPEAF